MASNGYVNRSFTRQAKKVKTLGNVIIVTSEPGQNSLKGVDFSFAIGNWVGCSTHFIPDKKIACGF